jgi:bifunctional non-homologous end joining protein LigD
MAPTLAKIPPVGPDWIHEVKFDGWRAQLHVENGSATLYSRNGSDITKRFNALRHSIERVPVKNAVIDCELVACDDSGMPSFRSLMALGNKAPALCLWAFDILFLDGVRLTPMPLEQRKAILSDVVSLADDQHLQFSGGFDDPIRLLAAGEKMQLRASSRSAGSLLTGRARRAIG